MRLFGHHRRDPEALRRHRLSAVDVLQDPEIRQGIKEYTTGDDPQLYVNGEFVGGCYPEEMYQAGELQPL
jgi:monothiol glutaredoxin